MTLLEKIRKIADLLLGLVAKDDEKIAELQSVIAERDATIEALKADFDNVDVALDEVLAELEETPTPEPVVTPGFDAVVKEANDSEVENTEAVNEAMESTVGTEEPTSEDAVNDAIEMLIA